MDRAGLEVKECTVCTIKITPLKGARVPLTIEKKDMVALIDTGAARSCMNTRQYELLGKPRIEKEGMFRVRSATGTDMGAIGLAICTFSIGGKTYEHPFVVCDRLITPIIIGFDFLEKHRLGIGWAEGGYLKVCAGKEELIRTMEEVKQYPVTLSRGIRLPPRSVAVATVRMNLPQYLGRASFKFTSVAPFTGMEEDCLLYPIDYTTLRGGHQRSLQVIINLGEEEKTIQEGTLVGYFERDDRSMVEVHSVFSSEEGEEIFKGAVKGFITSPADVDPRQPVSLRDAEVTPEHRAAFEALCQEFADIFSKDSSDLGKTPLLKMEIPTGDNPPVCQKPYTLALKHVQWVQDEIETLEKADVIT